VLPRQAARRRKARTHERDPRPRSRAAAVRGPYLPPRDPGQVRRLCSELLRSRDRISAGNAGARAG
jgi:hypothetical protein